MKRVALIIALCVCSLKLVAQQRPEFLGLPISGNTKTVFAERLIEKGYKYYNESDGYVMYSGQFLGCDASVMLVRSGSIKDGLTAIHVTIDEINPIKIGQLLAELTQKYMQKYSDYKYTTDVKPAGGTQIMFRKTQPNGLVDVVSIESKISGTKYGVSITYASDLKNDTATGNSNGIGIDDI